MVRRDVPVPHFCFAGSRPAMTMLAVAAPGQPSHRSISAARSRFCLSQSAEQARPLLGPLPKEPVNAPRQQTASTEIPIGSDAPLRHPSRGFLPWRFAYAGPRRAPRRHHGAAIRKPSQQRTHATAARSCFRLRFRGDGRRQRAMIGTSSPAKRRMSGRTVANLLTNLALDPWKDPR